MESEETPINPEAESTIPTIMFIRGKPGCGKSTATALFQEIHSDVKVVDPDKVSEKQLDIFKNEHPSRKGNHRQWLYRFNLSQAREYLQSEDCVVWEQPWSSLEGLQWTIENLNDAVPEGLRVILLDIVLDNQLAISRVAERKQNGGHGPSENTLNEMLEHFESVENISLGDIPIIIGGYRILDDTTPNSLSYAMKELWEYGQSN